jgi:transcriptional regulator
MGGEDRKDAMYIPQFNHVTDPAILHALMQHFSFATLVTQHEGRPFATHLPFLVEPEHGEQGRLLAHLAKANPQWTDFAPGREALVIFQGPHTYISPSWYETQPSVPTWNYAVVHAYGVPRVLEDDVQIAETLRRLVATHEEGFEEPWALEHVPTDYLQTMKRGIVTFEMPILRLEGKLKLSQNRSLADRERVIAALASRSEDGAQGVQALMQETLRPS